MGKLRDFLFYKKTINKNIIRLNEDHGLSKDWVYRLHKVYTFTKEDIDNVKVYGERYVETIIKKEISKIDKTIIGLKLYDLIGVLEYKTFPNLRSVGMLFGFKPFDTAKVASKLLWSTILAILGIGGFLLFSFKGLIYGSLIWLATFIITRIFILFRD